MDLKNFVTKTQEFINCDVKDSKHIAFACTENYICFAGITLTSVLLSNKGKFTFHIFADKCADNDLDKLNITAQNHKCNVFIHYVNNDIFNQSKDPGQFSLASYYRMIMPVFLEKYTDKFLYLDSDVGVYGDISYLWNVDTKGICAVVMPIQDKRHVNEGKRVGVDRYFCSGVMLINIAEWNEENISIKALKKSREDIKYLYPDQDILNILLQNKEKFVDNKYQYQYSMSYLMDHSDKPSLEKCPEDITILHYTGASKPWHSWVKTLDAAKKYVEVKQQSAWNNMPLVEPQTYKQIHKAARLAKKEGSLKDIIYWYYKYAVAKIKYMMGGKAE